MIAYVLAGGASKRMGGMPKGLSSLGGRTMVTHVVDRLAPQVNGLIVNANTPLPDLGPTVQAVIADDPGAGDGPLAGLLTCLRHAAIESSPARWIATAPWDCPFLPRDLITRLQGRSANAQAVIARSAGRDHYLAALWRVDLAEPLERAMLKGGVRSVRDWAARLTIAYADYGDAAPDPFFNVNCPADMAEAERILAKSEGDGTASLDRTGDL